MLSARLSWFSSVAIGVLAFASWKSHVARDIRVFDGQHTRPTPENGGVELKYFQLLGDTVGHNPPATFAVLFNQGHPLQFGPRDPTLPEYYLEVMGSFPNGSTFALTVPAESAEITACGQTVTGTWGTVSAFKGSPDLSTYTVRFTAPQFGLEGSFNLTSHGRRHLTCNTTTDPTFSSAVPAGTKLTPAEKYVYNQLGWLTSIPGGRSTAQLVIHGSKLDFSGQGYHDGNYAPAPLNTAADTWYSGVGQLGPYDLAFIFLIPINSTRILTMGYLSYDGVVLQNQCSMNGTKAADAVTITPFGVVRDATGENVPAGLIVQYTLMNGEQFRFKLTSPGNKQVVDQVVIHRWIGRIEGGKVGGKTYEGPFLYEWLNAQSKTYVPPS